MDALVAHVASAADRPAGCSCTRASGRSSDIRDDLAALVDEAGDDVLGVQDADDVVGRRRDRPAAGCTGWWRRAGGLRRRASTPRPTRGARAAPSTPAPCADPSLSAWCSLTCSCGSSRPPSRLSAMSSSISSGECTCRCPVFFTPHQLQQQVAAAVQEVDRPREGALGPLHRDDGPHRRSGRVLQRERLRHELADDHRQGRQDEQDDDRRGGLGGFGFAVLRRAG